MSASPKTPVADNDVGEHPSFLHDPATAANAKPVDGKSSGKETAALGYDDDRKPPEHDPHVEDQLDHGLKETFPASDPVSINPGAD
jgi:hypothetical protein